jgi:glutamate mutase epsilon subunit
MQTSTPQALRVAREALTAARAQLFAAALRSLARDALPPEQVVRVRRALKAGRSRRCSEPALEHAARECRLLTRQLQKSVGARDPRVRMAAGGCRNEPGPSQEG